MSTLLYFGLRVLNGYLGAMFFNLLSVVFLCGLSEFLGNLWHIIKRKFWKESFYCLPKNKHYNIDQIICLRNCSVCVFVCQDRKINLKSCIVYTIAIVCSPPAAPGLNSNKACSILQDWHIFGIFCILSKHFVCIVENSKSGKTSLTCCPWRSFWCTRYALLLFTKKILFKTAGVLVVSKIEILTF